MRVTAKLLWLANTAGQLITEPVPQGCNASQAEKSYTGGYNDLDKVLIIAW